MGRCSKLAVGVIVAVALSACVSNQDRLRTSISDADWQILSSIENDLLDAEFGLDAPALDQAAKGLAAFRTTEVLNPEALTAAAGLGAWQAWLAGDAKRLGTETALAQSKGNGSEWAVLAQALGLIRQQKTAEAQALMQKRVASGDKAPRLKLRLAVLASQGQDQGQALSLLDAAWLDYPKDTASHLAGFRKNLLNAAQLGIQSSAGMAVSQRTSLDWRTLLTTLLGETKLPQLIGVGPGDNPTQLLKALTSAKLLPNAPADPQAAVLRSEAAGLVFRFLSNYGPDATLARRYRDWLDALAKGRREPSLIPDLPSDRQVYFPVKTLVERDLMTLPDGKNFQPEAAITGLDLISALRALERELAAKLQVLND